MANYQGKATGKYELCETKNGTPYVAVDVDIFGDNGEKKGTITHKFFFSATSAKNVEISTEGLRLLGARMMHGDPTDMFGLGSTTVGVVTEHTQYGEEIKYINPPGPRARGVKDEEKLDQSKIAAFRARFQPLVAGVMASKGAATSTPQPTSHAPWQGQQRPQQTPAGAQPWDRQTPPAPASGPQVAQSQTGDVGDPWNQPDAYDGLGQPSQAPAPQAAAGGRRAPF